MCTEVNEVDLPQATSSLDVAVDAVMARYGFTARQAAALLGRVSRRASVDLDGACALFVGTRADRAA